MNHKDLLDIMDVLKKMIDSEPSKDEFKKVFKFNNEEYGFVPNLNKLSTGEYIDLESYCKEPIKNLHIIMSILYRKVTYKVNNRYAIEVYDPDQFKEELFKSCPMDMALGTLGFFLNIGLVLAKNSLHYLKAQEGKQQKA